MQGLGIVLTIVIILIIFVLATYNSLISKKNKVKQAKASIDVYLTQRFDLIPNLVECVKGYMQYEEEIFENLTAMRAKYFESKNLKDGEKLNNECNKIIANAENYPELKASEQFLYLQKNLTKIENQLQAARRIYNVEVTKYNNKVLMFPSNIIAGLLGYEEEDYFEVEEQARNNIKINEG